MTNLGTVAVFGAAGALLQQAFFREHLVNVGVFGDLITMFSIIIGFYITSFAIFASSTYVASLYKVIDTDDRSRTLLHRLIGNFHFGLTLSLVSVAYLVVLDLFLTPEGGDFIRLGRWELLPLFAFIVVDIFYCYTMLNDLSLIVLQQGKKPTR